MNLSAIGKILKGYPVLFVCGLLILFSSGLLMMRGPKVEQRQRELQDLERMWNQMQLNFERSRDLESELTRLEDQLQKLRGRLFEIQEVAENFEFFYQLEEESNVTLEQFTQGKPGNGDDLHIGGDGLSQFSVLPYTMVARGGFPDLLAFFTALNSSEPILRLDSISIVKTADSVRSQELVARFNCHVLANSNN
jgi:Tfp pilus assembly protein PilO